jgi:hypothetical protein
MLKRLLTLAVSIMIALTAFVMNGSAARADAISPPMSTIQAAKAKRACVGLRLTRFPNSDRLTLTTRLTPVFRGGNPPNPYTSASVWFNNTKSPYNYGQPGRYVDIFHAPHWKITGLIVKVSSSELVYGGAIYRCPNTFYR